MRHCLFAHVLTCTNTIRHIMHDEHTCGRMHVCMHAHAKHAQTPPPSPLSFPRLTTPPLKMQAYSVYSFMSTIHTGQAARRQRG